MILGMPNSEYHAHPAISSSDVKLVASKSLAHWKHKVRKPSTAFALGSAVHAMVLEPHLDLVVRGPEDRRGNKWKEASLAADLDGKILLTETDFDQAAAMAASVNDQRIVAGWKAVEDFVAEASFFAKDPITGVDIKCRPDGFIPSQGIVFDVKTTSDASPKGFPREVIKYGYDLQAAFYLRCLRAAGFNATTFIFVCVEKEPPFATGLHMLTPEYLTSADVAVTMTLEDIANATARGDFTTGWPLINHINLPRWQSVDQQQDAFDETETIDF